MTEVDECRTDNEGCNWDDEEQMRVDVDGLVVKIRQANQTGTVGVRYWAVAGQNVRVVLGPGWHVIEAEQAGLRGC